ncbi:hypothetical protein SSX86_023816 [Deinandra increscens subsp. villosa]|uniref:Uncharacterized protein n=1 Tax=Deinandra increscens subsp. villosa TaxID=3103831 RepID=A0AAP0CGY7_9ASTR
MHAKAKANSNPPTTAFYVENTSSGQANMSRGSSSDTFTQKAAVTYPVYSSQSSSIPTSNQSAFLAKTTNDFMALFSAMISSYDGVIAGKLTSAELTDEDYEQIDPDDLELMDINWSMAMIVSRGKKFMKRTGRKDLNPEGKLGFDKSKVRCYNCQNYGHFAKECSSAKKRETSKLYQKYAAQSNKASGSNGNPSSSNTNAGGLNSDSKALVSQTGEGYDWAADYPDESAFLCTEEKNVVVEDNPDLPGEYFFADGHQAFMADIQVNSNICEFCMTTANQMKKLSAEKVMYYDKYMLAEENVTIYKKRWEDVKAELKKNFKNSSSFASFLCKDENLKEVLKESGCTSVPPPIVHGKGSTEPEIKPAVVFDYSMFAEGSSDNNKGTHKRKPVKLVSKSDKEVLKQSESGVSVNDKLTPLEAAQKIIETEKTVKEFEMTKFTKGRDCFSNKDKKNFKFGNSDDKQKGKTEVGESSKKVKMYCLKGSDTIFLDEAFPLCCVDPTKVSKVFYADSEEKCVSDHEHVKTDSLLKLRTSLDDQNFVKTHTPKDQKFSSKSKTSKYSPKNFYNSDGQFSAKTNSFDYESYGFCEDYDFYDDFGHYEQNFGLFGKNKSKCVESQRYSENCGVDEYGFYNQFGYIGPLFKPLPKHKSRRFRAKKPSQVVKHMTDGNTSTESGGNFPAFFVDCRRCYHCHQKGHLRKRCLVLAEKRASAVIFEKSKNVSEPKQGARKRAVNNFWVVDSGASRHMTGNISLLSDVKPIQGGNVTLAGDKGGKITGEGKLGNEKITFDKVQIVQELQHNLLSVSQICDKQYTASFTSSECLILKPGIQIPDDWIVVRAPRFRDLYVLNMNQTSSADPATCFISKATEKDSIMWHRCKQKKKSHPSKRLNSIVTPLELLHMDLFGPVIVRSIEGSYYCLVITDDFSRFSWVLSLASKDETPDQIQKLLSKFPSMYKHKVCRIRTDNGSEFKNAKMAAFCDSLGIFHEFNASYTPQQNGVAERKNRTLIEAARTLLADANLPMKYWSEAVHTACYVLNHVLIVKRFNKTSYELLKGRKPNLNFFVPFGCLCTVLKEGGKFASKAVQGVFVGYHHPMKRVYLPSSKTIENHVNVDCQKHTFLHPKSADAQSYDYKSLIDSFTVAPSGSEEEEDPDILAAMLHSLTTPGPGSWIPKLSSTAVASFSQSASSLDTMSSSDDDESMFHEAESTPVDDQINLPSTSSSVPNSLPIGDLSSSEVAEASLNDLADNQAFSDSTILRINNIHPQENIIGDPSSGVRTRNQLAGNIDALIAEIRDSGVQNEVFHSCFLSQVEPSNVDKALEDASWVEAMQEELQQFTKLGVWHLVDLPKNSKEPCGTKWVFKCKKDDRGVIVRNKARLVVQGFSKIEGINFNEVYAPVSRIEAIRIFLAFAAHHGFKVYQMNVKSAFLNGKIREEVYVKQPPGFYDSEFPDKVYKLEKALYGLHQAPRACTKDSLCKEFERVMQTKFEMSSMGEMGFFLGLQVKQSAKGIFLHQSKYVSDMLTQFKIGDVRIPSTPLQVSHGIEPDESDASVDPTLFRAMIGSLMYLTASRPDIMFAGNPDLGIWYPNDNKFELSAYSDSDYGGCKINFKSTTVGCQFLGERLVSWQCKKQTSVATSTAEAEYVAASSCFSQVLWIQQQLRDYDMADFKSKGEHNVCAFLDASARWKPHFLGIFDFMRRSRICYAATHMCTPYKDLLVMFWNSAQVDCSVVPSVIRARILQTDVVISEEDVRRVLRLNDQADFPMEFDEADMVALLRRIKYDGQLYVSWYLKANLSPPYKYLLHVIIKCFGNRTRGQEEFDLKVLSFFAALVLNRQFNFSGWIFSYMKENILTKQVKSLMYPRFLQMILNELHPNLPKNQNAILVMKHMNRVAVGKIPVYRKRKGNNIPPPVKRLIGHLANPNYVAPADGAARNPESSDDELEYNDNGFPIEIAENEKEDHEAQANQAPNVQQPIAQDQQPVQQQEQPEQVIPENVTEPEAVNTLDDEIVGGAGVSEDDTDWSSADNDSDSGDYVTILHNTREIPVKKGSKAHIAYLKSQNLDTSMYETRTKQVEDKDDDPLYTPVLNEPVTKTKTVDKGKAPMTSTGKRIKHMARPNVSVKQGSFLADARKSGLTPPSKKQKVSTPSFIPVQPTTKSVNVQSSSNPPVRKLIIRRPSGSASASTMASASTTTSSTTSTISSTDLKLALHQTRLDKLDSTNRQQADEIRGLKNLLNLVLKALPAHGERRPDPEESCKDDDDVMKYLNQDPDPEGGVGGESSEKEVYDITPISRVELKEGEFINPYSKEQLAAIFALNVDDMDNVPFADPYTEEDSDDHVDYEKEHVEVEDIMAEEYPDDPKVYGNFSADDHSGGFNFFGNEDEEKMDKELKKKESETAQLELNESEKLSEEEEKKLLFEAWLKEQRTKKLPVVKPAKIVDQKKYFDRKGGVATGGIISWMYDSELKCYAIKKEFGVMYLKHATRFNTLPVCDVRDLSRSPFLNYGGNVLAEIFKNKFKEECQGKFRFLTPQRPKYIEHPTDIHPVTGKPVVILKYKKPIQLKKIPLKKLEQDFIKTLRWWYYE